jgi:hypothetical protein
MARAVELLVRAVLVVVRADRRDDFRPRSLVRQILGTETADEGARRLHEARAHRYHLRKLGPRAVYDATRLDNLLRLPNRTAGLRPARPSGASEDGDAQPPSASMSSDGQEHSPATSGPTCRSAWVPESLRALSSDIVRPDAMADTSANARFPTVSAEKGDG